MGSENQLDITKNIFILAAMMVVSGAVGFIAWANFGMMITHAAICAIGVLIVQFFGYLMVWKALVYEDLRKKIHELTLSDAENANGIDRLSNETQGLRKIIKTTTQAEIEPLARELEVISSLIKQLAENSADTEMRLADMQNARDVERVKHPSPAAAQLSSASPEPAPPRNAPNPTPDAPRSTVQWFEEDGSEDDVTFAEDATEPSMVFEKAPVEEPIDYSSPILKAVRSAVDHNRVDLYLQPIVTLPQRKPKYYEALSRIRTDDGELIRPAQYLRPAEQTGAMPILDKMLLVRAVQVLQRLIARKSDSVVVCNISANSLADTRFFNDFRMLLKAKSDLADHLIFEFNQETVNAFGAIEEESIRALKELGFRFAVDNVTKISMDFHRLVDLGFHFMKVSADVLLSSKSSGIRDIHPQDIPRYLARNGIELIVDHIETESQVVELLDFGVSLGQGFLFAAPREIKPDATAIRSATKKRVNG